MPDREKVIQGLQELIDHLFHEYNVCYNGDEEDCYNRFLQANNAMNLLKEQGENIATMRMVYGSDVNVVGEIVRCKDCKYWNNEVEQAKTTVWLPCREMSTFKNWYCADGERRSDDD